MLPVRKISSAKIQQTLLVMPTLYHFLSSNVTIEFSVNMASIQQMLSSHQTSLQAKQHSKKSQSVTNY